MAVLLIVALVLAWPTYGLSVIGWLVFMFVKSNGSANRSIERKSRAEWLEPLFTGRFADFFYALDIPTWCGEELSNRDAQQCGRHIMNYVAQNTDECVLFVKGLIKWRSKGDLNLCHPVIAASDENRLKSKGEIHLVSYRAIEALMIHNPNLHCFRQIDLSRLEGCRNQLELNFLSAA